MTLTRRLMNINKTPRRIDRRAGGCNKKGNNQKLLKNRL